MKKLEYMKKVFGILLTICLLFSQITVYAENDTNSLEPALVNASGYTAEEWFESEESRALLTVLLALEYSSYDESFDISCLDSNTSYVMYDKESSSVMVYMQDGDMAQLITYIPRLETAMISDPTNATTEFTIEMVFEVMGYKYEKNSTKALHAAVASIDKLLTEMAE